MDNASFGRLKEDNKEELRWQDHWDAVIDGRERVRITGRL